MSMHALHGNSERNTHIRHHDSVTRWPKDVLPVSKLGATVKLHAPQPGAWPFLHTSLCLTESPLTACRGSPAALPCKPWQSAACKWAAASRHK